MPPTSRRRSNRSSSSWINHLSSTTTLLLLSSSYVTPARAQTNDAPNATTLPRIDFAALGTVGVVGSFAGLQFYDQANPPTSYSPTVNSFIRRDPVTGAFVRLGETDEGGSIDTICSIGNGTVFLGGNFTSIAGVEVNNVAAFDPSTSSFSALSQGLDGRVTALSCNESNIVVGGSFLGPNGVNATSLGYAGNVASWDIAAKAWSPLPFKGLNGPVRTIESSPDGKSLYFGGNFSTLFTNSTNLTATNSTSFSASNRTFASLGSSLVPISLNQSDYVASPTTYTSGFGRPEYIFCPKHEDGVGASWLLVDGTDGYFLARTYRPLQVRGVRLGNTQYGGRGTKTFRYAPYAVCGGHMETDMFDCLSPSFVSIPDNQVLNLTYASDPRNASSSLLTCSSECPLSHDPDVPYQDFLFPENTTLTGFQLNLLSFYGPGAGLHLLQLLSEGAFAYAVNQYNAVTCTSGLGASNASTVSTTGAWNETKVVSSEIPGTTQNVLVSYIEAGTQKYQSPTITWKPFVAQSGNYSIYLDTPGCALQGNCENRLGHVGVYVTPYGNLTFPAGQNRVHITEVNQTNTEDAQVLIYQGPLIASDITNPSLEVTICLGDMGAPTNGSVFELVANLVTLVANSTSGNGSLPVPLLLTPAFGIYEYAAAGAGAFSDAMPVNITALNATSVMSNATGLDQVASRLANGSIINSIVSVGTDDSAIVFFGGNLTYESNATTNANLTIANSTIAPAKLTVGTSTNVLAFTKSAGVVLAPNGGLDGVVTSLVALNGVLYAAGQFESTVDGSVTGLQGLARWTYANTSVWVSLGEGLPASLAGQVSQLAVIASVTDSSTVESIAIVGDGGNSAGVTVFNPITNSFNSSQAGLVIGNISAVGTPADPSNANASTYLAGNIFSATNATSPSGAFLSRGSDGSPQLTSFDYRFLSESNAANSADEKLAPTPTRKVRRSNSMRSLATDVVSSLFTRAVSEIVTSLPSALSALSPNSSDNEVLAGVFWKNGSTEYMILAGHYSASAGAVNIGLYNVSNDTLAPLEGESILGTVSTLEIAGDVLWIGGNFTATNSMQGLTTYQLKTSQALDQPPALTGYAGEVPVVYSIQQRPGYSSQIIVAGAYATAGSVTSCQSICSWDTGLLQWSPFNGGLQGVVGSIAFAGGRSDRLYAAGDFVVNGQQTYLAQWFYDNSTWNGVGTVALPGPATAISTDGGSDDKIFVAGSLSSNAEPYLWYFNGTAWLDVNNGVVTSSGEVGGIQQLALVPLTTAHPANKILESNRMLLVSGSLTINDTSFASALYDGDHWYPYLVATSASAGASGAISQLFYSMRDFSLSTSHHLGVGLVILISIAIALGVVFLLVLIGLLIALARRREEEKPNEVRDQDEIDSINGAGGARRPTSLLATVGAATAVLLDSKNEKNKGAAPVEDDDSLRGGAGVVGGMSYDSHGYDDGEEPLEADSTARARYSFTAEHPGELSVSAGEDLTVLENGDPNWFLVANSSGARGLMPASYLA